MMWFSAQFAMANSDVIEYNGKKVHRFLKIEKPGEYLLKFKFISSNSQFSQAIDIHYGGIKGNMYFLGENITKRKSTFAQAIFFEDDIASRCFELELKLKEGWIAICNGSDRDGSKRGCSTLVEGCAMIIEEIKQNHYRFFCNDFENDDDFDDLIFELEIVELENTANDSLLPDEI